MDNVDKSEKAQVIHTFMHCILYMREEMRENGPNNREKAHGSEYACINAA